MILKRKLFALEDDAVSNSGTARCTARLAPGQQRKRGRPCESCELMSEKTKITSNVSKKSYNTASGNCKSKRLIYCAACKICNKQYVGKTDTMIRCRICGHRVYMQKDSANPLSADEKDDASLANHLKSQHFLSTVDDFNDNYCFTILQIDPSNLDKCEQEWVSRLVTMTPFGLNIEKPQGVSDSLLLMSSKSSQRK